MTLAAEFPNDNPDLHEGTIWVCLEVTGAPVAERHLRAIPVAVAPVVLEPAIVEPVFVEPVFVEPVFVEPVLVEPVFVEPVAIEPVAIEPVAIEPVAIEPAFEPIAHPVIATLAEPILPPTVEAVVEPVVDVEPPASRESGIFMTFSSLKDEDELEEEEEILVEELGPLEDAILEAAVEPTIGIIEPIAEPITEPIVEPIVEAVVEPVLATIAPPAPDDAYVTFVSALVDIAIAQGATAAAAELPATLEGDTTAQAWAGILRGTSEDWDAIGGSMLDEWAADTLARATGADAQVLKRELRARGVAAFGLAA